MLGLFSYLLLAAGGQITSTDQAMQTPQGAIFCSLSVEHPGGGDIDIYFLPLSQAPAGSGESDWDAAAIRWVRAGVGAKATGGALNCRSGDFAVKSAALYLDGQAARNLRTPPGFTRYHFVDAPSDWAVRGPRTQRQTHLRTATLSFLAPQNTREQSGYQSATIDLDYRFVACEGDIFLAYGLDLSSLRPGAGYMVRGRQTEAAAGRRPALRTVAFAGQAQRVGEAGVIISFPVADAFAGKARGYGCLDGQLQKVGSIAEVAGPTLGADPTPEQLSGFLDGDLTLAAADVTEPLRDVALEGLPDARVEPPAPPQSPPMQAAPAATTDAVGQADAAPQYPAPPDVVTTDADEAARTQALNAEAAARAAAQAEAQRQAVAEAEAAKRKYETDLRASDAAKAKFDRDQAAFQEAFAKSQADQARYDAEMAAWRKANHKD